LSTMLYKLVMQKRQNQVIAVVVVVVVGVKKCR
jgi:hypothetical protein